MLFIVAFAGTLIALSLLLLSPMKGVLATLALKPIIDATWNHGFLGTNLLEIMGVAVPLLILPRILLSRGKRFMDMELAWLAIAVFFANIIGVTSLVANGKFYSALDYFFRILNHFTAFFLFQYYFAEKENFKKLLIALLLAGVFPVLVGIYQSFTGNVWREHYTSFGMVRYQGLYHDAVAIRIIGFQTLAAILLYWAYFVPTKYWSRFFLFLYAVACAFVIFRAYTKTGMLNLAAWAIIWFIFTRKIAWLFAILSLIIIVNFSLENRLITDSKQVFIKEIGAYDGTMEGKYILAGRTLIWEAAWKNWSEQGIFEKMFGSGANPPVHNEYLRVLICNGIIGLVAFTILILFIAFRVIKNMHSRASPLNVVALMVFVMLFIDTLGLHPGLYPGYQWFVYGIVTLSLAGIRGLETQQPEKQGPIYVNAKKNA